jgi:hypothetical protein
MDIVFSDHALFEMGRRAIPKEVIIEITENPVLVMPSRHGRVVVQGKYLDPRLNKEMVLRIIGVQEKNVFKVITVYKTSKFDKYWAEGSSESNL